MSKMVKGIEMGMIIMTNMAWKMAQKITSASLTSLYLLPSNISFDIIFYTNDENGEEAESDEENQLSFFRMIFHNSYFFIFEIVRKKVRRGSS